MTDMEIPQAAIEAGAKAAFESIPGVWPWDQLTENEQRPRLARAEALLKAALPHLLTEVKSLCETATALGLALGRKEAGDIAADMIFGVAEEVGDGNQQEMLRDLAAMVRSIASQPPEAGSNGLTASSRHPDTPEDTKPPQDCPGCGQNGTGLENHRRDCERNPAYLPEESDQ